MVLTLKVISVAACYQDGGKPEEVRHAPHPESAQSCACGYSVCVATMMPLT